MERWSDSFIGTIKQGLFGDSSYTPASMAIEAEPVSPERIVSDLCPVEEVDWFPYAFSRDPLNGRLSDELRLGLMREACACGREQARACKERHGTSHPAVLAERMGVSVERPSMPQSLDRVLFAEFVEPATINLFQDGIDRAAELLRDGRVSAELGGVGTVANVLLAHELFHVVELRAGKQFWTRSYRFDLTRGRGPLRYHGKLVTLSEAAAMAFARELVGVAWSPYVLDCVLAYAYSPTTAHALYDEMLTLTRQGREIRSASEGAQDTTRGEGIHDDEESSL